MNALSLFAGDKFKSSMKHAERPFIAKGGLKNEQRTLR
jgi:hypothetical protein